MDWLEIDGVRLEYRWIGPGPQDAPTLVLLHEGLGCAALWKDFPDRLAAATGWGVLAYSRAGYGASDGITLPRPLTYHHPEAEVVLPAILDALGIARAVLVGHSDGATIALLNAGGVCDPRVLGAVAMAPHVFNEQLAVDSIRGAETAFEQGDLRARLARYHGDNVDCAFWGWCDTWLDPAFWHWNIGYYLPSVRIPLLLIQGKDDHYGTAAQIETIESHAGGPVETLWLDDCGHSPQLEQTEATLRAIAGFVADMPA